MASPTKNSGEITLYFQDKHESSTQLSQKTAFSLSKKGSTTYAHHIICDHFNIQDSSDRELFKIIFTNTHCNKFEFTKSDTPNRTYVIEMLHWQFIDNCSEQSFEVSNKQERIIRLTKADDLETTIHALSLKFLSKVAKKPQDPINQNYLSAIALYNSTSFIKLNQHYKWTGGEQQLEVIDPTEQMKKPETTTSIPHRI